MLLKGKKALVLGAANERSIAWAIAKAFYREGCIVGLTYVNDKIKEKMESLIEEVKSPFVAKLDVTNENDFEQLTLQLERSFQDIDIVVHSLAYAEKEDLEKNFSLTSKKGFLLAHEISSYSFIETARVVKPFLTEKSSLMTLTYYGSQKVIPHYNVMGLAKASLESAVRYLAYDLGSFNIRVNALSAGPIKTFAASAIPGFSTLLNEMETKSVLKEPLKSSHLADAAVFLGSDLSQLITGQILYVDGGLSIRGL